MSLARVRRRECGPVDGLPVDLHPVLRRIYSARGIVDADSLSLKLQDLLPPAGLLGLERAE